MDPTPLYTEEGGCIHPNPPPCHDHGTDCGNSCEIPHAATCTDLVCFSASFCLCGKVSDSLGCFLQAKEFHLTDARFRVLNPKLDCSKQVSKGRSVCMGGSCGD